METGSGSQVSVTVYYPYSMRPLVKYKINQEAPFPVVVFSPGAGGPATDYSSILTELASYGFVVAGASWNYDNDREKDTAHDDHTDLLDLLEEYGNDINTPIYGLVDTDRCGAFGHSRGGRVAFMASGSDDRIDAVAAWMPTLNNASHVEQSVSKYLFGGDEDEVVPPDEWLDPLFKSCEETIAFVNVFGGNHQPEQEIHIDLTMKFFRYHLKGEESLEDELYGLGIRERAESGEFHLRMKWHGDEYDSHPDLTPEDTKVRIDTNGGDNETPIFGGIDAILLVLMSLPLLFRKRNVKIRLCT
jgi:dienelactone hydrolase